MADFVQELGGLLLMITNGFAFSFIESKLQNRRVSNRRKKKLNRLLAYSALYH
jgi:uncharacterized membrane protein